MFAHLFRKIVVGNPISAPINRKTHHRFINCSSILQIHANSAIEDSSLRTKNSDNALSITKLLKSYGFTDTQVAKFFNRFPHNSMLNSTELIKTKLDIFLKVGFSNTRLAKFVCTYPSLMAGTLEKRLKPNLLLLKSFYETEEQLLHALSRSSSLLQTKLETHFFPNIRILTNHGVPHGNIVKIAIQRPRTLFAAEKKFIDKVHLISSMGFDPRSTRFCLGLQVIIGTSPLLWKKKINLYKSFGWSEDDVVSAFVRHPCCMFASEEKIKQTMNFFVNIRQNKPSLLVGNPVLISLSLQKRIMPRCLVIDILMEKKLIKKSSVKQYMISNNEFFEKYVMPFQDQTPEILTAYNGDPNFVCLKDKSLIS